jgi:hypothetical protein
MKATKGKANPAMLDQLLKQLIDEGEARRSRFNVVPCEATTEELATLSTRLRGTTTRESAGCSGSFRVRSCRHCVPRRAQCF